MGLNNSLLNDILAESMNEYLLSVPTKFEKELKKGVISEELGDIFKLKSMPENRVIKKVGEGWRMDDGEKTFIIKKDNGKLSVYSSGEDHVTVIKKLSEPKHDEDLALELNIKATVVRTLLNDLHAKDMVEYERTKNKKTGWYTYLWKKREDKVDEFIQSYVSHKVEGLNKQLETEKERATFKCSCNRVILEDAMETNFICPGCNETFTEFDNTGLINELKSEINKINKLLK